MFKQIVIGMTVVSSMGLHEETRSTLVNGEKVPDAIEELQFREPFQFEEPEDVKFLTDAEVSLVSGLHEETRSELKNG